MEELIPTVVDLIVNSQKIVVFTGAGVSTESGIQDFRSPGGLWERYDPEDFTYQRFISSETAREKYWEMSSEFYHVINKARPNPTHEAIAELEKMGKLDCLITQNVDGLHQMAGSSPEKILELHGTTRTVSCLSCKKGYTRDEVQEMIVGGVKVPRCDQCDGILKPDTISFGQAMPERETAEAVRRSEECDLFIVIGSSLVVHPAASMPLVAKERGAKLVIINRDPTPQDSLADAVVRGSAGAIMSEIIQGVRQG
jgi:NAD-dependent deacetylase